MASWNSTFNSIKNKLNALILYANNITGKNDVCLTDAVRTLGHGYQESFQSLDLQLRLIGTWEGDLPEYTSTTSSTVDTGINVKELSYIYLLTTIECDGEYDPAPSAKEWSGFSLAIGGLYNSNHCYNACGIFGYPGAVRPQVWSELKYGVTSNHGITLSNNSSTIKFTRVANASTCPRVMGGHYTVKVYALVFV